MVGSDKRSTSSEIDDESLEKAKLIAEKKKQLEQTADQVRREIRDSFGRLGEALAKRERQLLRQIEAVHRQQLLLIQSNSELLPTDSKLNAELNGENELIQRLLDFGKIDLSKCIDVKDHEPYRAEEYQEAAEDFVSFDKSLRNESDEFDVINVSRCKNDNCGEIGCTNISINLDHKKNENNVFSQIEDKKTDVLPVVIAATTKQHNNALSMAAGPSGVKENPNSDENIGNNNEINDKNIEDIEVTKKNNDFSSSLNQNSSIIKNETVKSSTLSIVHNNNTSSDVKDDIKIDSDSCIQTPTKVKQKEIVNNKTKDVGDEHPIQIQQWLQQILAETETEPSIHEIGQFSMIPNTRLYTEFSVET